MPKNRISKGEKIMAGTCPACGAPLEGATCAYCGYEQPQEAQDNGAGNGYGNPQGVTNPGYADEGYVNSGYQTPQYVRVCSSRSKMVALVLCILLGYLGVHRFYVGKIGTGLIWFLTAGCFGIGWIVDIVTIAIGSFTDNTGLPLKK